MVNYRINIGRSSDTKWPKNRS